jgi:hypothetical protein
MHGSFPNALTRVLEQRLHLARHDVYVHARSRTVLQNDLEAEHRLMALSSIAARYRG